MMTLRCLRQQMALALALAMPWALAQALRLLAQALQMRQARLQRL
jgi:hypothetical protein